MSLASNIASFCHAARSHASGGKVPKEKVILIEEPIDLGQVFIVEGTRYILVLLSLDDHTEPTLSFTLVQEEAYRKRYTFWG
jgi:hypothetical protein